MNSPINGTPQVAALQYQIQMPQPGVLLFVFLQGQLCNQFQMSVKDDETFSAKVSDAVDKAKSPIASVGPGDIPAGVKLKG